MATYRYRLLDSDGLDLGPFVSSRVDWLPGAMIPQVEGYLLVTAVVDPETNEDFQAYLVVEQFDPDR
jgi:hypothetical protein